MRTTAIILMTTAVAGLVACGGEDPLSRAELTQRVNVTCGELEKLGAGAERPGREEIGEFFDRTVPQLEERLDELPAAARAPQAISGDYERFVASRREELDALRDVGDTAEDLVAATEASERLERLRGRSDALAEKLGFTACTR